MLKRDLGLSPVNSRGRRSGSWVQDVTVLELLEFLESDAVHGWTHLDERYDVRVCYIDAATGAVDMPDPDSDELPEKNMLLLVTHTASETQGYHFSVIIINPSHKLIHFFDTLSRWTDTHAMSVIDAQFPAMALFAHGYELRNHTGQIHQSAATCGAWSLWICYAYAFNFNGCRGEVDSIRCRSMQADAVAFWRAVTY